VADLFLSTTSSFASCLRWLLLRAPRASLSLVRGDLSIRRMEREVVGWAYHVDGCIGLCATACSSLGLGMVFRENPQVGVMTKQKRA
jgi:hypothetical protein